MLTRPLTIRDIPLILLFVVSWAAITWIAVHYDSPDPRTPVGANIPDDFPVLVISSTGESYSAKIVPNYDLDEYTSKLKDYSFLVPAGKASDLNGQVARGYRYDDDRFEVSELPHGKQYLKVVWHWRGATIVETGWYVAERKSFVPKYYQSGGIPMMRALLWAPFTFVANVILWLIGGFAYRRIRRRQAA